MSAGWRESAACIDKPVEWFFPSMGGSLAYARGLEVCAGCPVRAECLAERDRAERELCMPISGLWGGSVRETAHRRAERQRTPRACVVCAGRLTDSGTGRPPRFCDNRCACRHSYRQRIGAPTSDVDFEAWKEWHRAHVPREKLEGSGPSDPQRVGETVAP